MPNTEKELISLIRKLSRAAQSGPKSWRLGVNIINGIGDDCAVLRPKPGHEILITTDFSLEGTHFRREWHPAETVGHRCLARGLSDIAAMGGEPVAAFLSLGLPADLPQKWVDGFFRGFLKLAHRYGVQLAGGDIAESKTGVLADIVVVGSVQRGKAILRSGAQEGDVICVTGALGGSAVELEKLLKPQINAAATSRQLPAASRRLKDDRHFFPELRLAIGEYLRKKKIATAMIDVSDGLSTDLAHICEESGVGAILVEPLIPIAAGANLQHALHGGEDYELLFTVRRSANIPLEIAGVRVTQIGWVTKKKGLFITDCKKKSRKLEVMGWEHFGS